MSLPNGIICTMEEYARSLRDSSIHCLSRTDTMGLMVIVETGLLSLISVSVVFLLIMRNVIYRFRRMRASRLRVFHQPMDLLMISLFIADILQAIGGILNIKWISEGKVMAGNFCNAQGIIQNIGETGVALSTLAIAVYTLVGVWLMRRIQSMKITLGVLVVIWIFILITVTVGNTINRDPGKPSYESPTPYWCWISIEYMPWRIFAEYLWLWFTLVFSFSTYVPLFLWMRGNIALDDNAWWKCTIVTRGRTPPDRVTRRRALIMLAYPTIYCLTVLPLTVARWMGFDQQAKYGRTFVPSAATFFGTAVFGLSGFFNVVLLLTTKPLLFGRLMFVAGERPPSPLPSEPQPQLSPVNVEERSEYPPGRLPLDP